jgi:peptidoglycan hydrolase-like protein with peptidoglycan-binding domain
MQFHASPYSPEDPDLGDYGMTSQRTDVSAVGYASKGSTGPNVATLHQALINHPSIQAGEFAYSSDVKNQKFGSETHDLVQDFQLLKGLGVDGKVGKNTWAALDRPGVHVYEYSGSGSTSQKLTASGDDATRKGIAAKAKGITEQPWFWPVVAGGSILLIGGTLLYIRKK